MRITQQLQVTLKFEVSHKSTHVLETRHRERLMSIQGGGHERQLTLSKRTLSSCRSQRDIIRRNVVDLPPQASKLCLLPIQSINYASLHFHFALQEQMAILEVGQALRCLVGLCRYSLPQSVEESCVASSTLCCERRIELCKRVVS